MGNVAGISQTMSDPVILNEELQSADPAQQRFRQDQHELSTFQLLAEMDAVVLRLKSQFISEDGRAVDYRAMATSETFQTYVNLSRKLISLPLDLLSELQLKILFLNLYNLLTLHALAEKSKEGALASPAKIPAFWKTIKYNVGGFIFSLDDIEHGILRANRAHPLRKLISRSHFSSSDPRSKYSLKSCDPRLHFVLNCGSQSCPRVTFLNGQDADEKVERTLTAAARAFCQENIILREDNREIWLSKIFDWYQDDFGSDHPNRLALLSTWLSDDQRKILTNLTDSKFQVKFLPYDWTLNNQNLGLANPE